jgi:hypothetical protein
LAEFESFFFFTLYTWTAAFVALWELSFHNYACFVTNRSPSAAIDFKVPEEVWSGKPVAVDRARSITEGKIPHKNHHEVEKGD